MRCARKCAAASLLLAALTGAAQGADEVVPADSSCPGAAAWSAAHPEQSDEAMAQRDAARTFTEPALRVELAERVAKDQKWRSKWLANRSSRVAQRTVTQVDEDNLRWLDDIVRAKGFPTLAQVGEGGVHHAWLLAHHADRAPGFQATLLPVLEQRHASGELSASDLARFTDRVLKAQGRPQHYGTQFPPEEWNTSHFGLPDEASVHLVDQQRRALGVMPLADYVCMMSHARLGKR